MANQRSIISYVPQPFHVAGTTTIAAGSGVSSIENGDGVFDPDLSNYATVNANASAASFAVQIDFAKLSSHLSGADLTVALIGCSLLTYEDASGSPDPDSEFSENISMLMSSDLTAEASTLFSFAHNSQDGVKTFNAQPLPSVISGGRSNLVFHGLGAAAAGATATVTVTVERAAADVTARPHAKLLLGHLFVGSDLEVTIDPRVFSWSLQLANERFRARDFGAVNSDGTLVRRAIGEFIKITVNDLMGAGLTGVSPVAITPAPNFLDMIKAGASYPLLFNSYPAGLTVDSTVTVAQADLTARQNFFSVYGFFMDPLEVQTREFRDGLATEYRARFRFEETR